MQGCGVVETRTGSLRPRRIGGAGDEVVVLGGAHGPDAEQFIFDIGFSTVRADVGVPVRAKVVRPRRPCGVPPAGHVVEGHPRIGSLWDSGGWVSRTS